MPDLSRAARKAMMFWPIIEAGARAGLTTADLWSEIRDYAEEMGLSGPGVGAAGVSALRGLAGAIQRSGREFERTGDDQGLHAGMIAEAPWARGLPEQNALNLFQVRYLHGIVTEDGYHQEWRTSMFQGRLPGTVGELREAIGADAAELAAKYGVSNIDFASVQIMRV